MSKKARLDVSAFMQMLLSVTDQSCLSCIESAETAYNAQAARMYGFVALSNAFKSFLLETVRLSSTWRNVQSSETHGWLLSRMAGSFHTICGAEREALWGYPVPAFAQLRNLFDTAVISSAVAQKFATYLDAEGLEAGKPFDPGKFAARRKRTEFEIFSQMVRKDSGLSTSTLDELDKLNKLYDWETHGQRMTATRTLDWMKGQAPLSFLPEYKELDYALFVNRHTEVTWMLHRLVPLMLPQGVASREDWSSRWSTIDKCFHQAVEAMSIDLKKAVGDAVIEFVIAKFPFDADSRLSS